jgi:hypothetical protein
VPRESAAEEISGEQLAVGQAAAEAQEKRRGPVPRESAAEEISGEKIRQIADGCLARRKFSEFILWLDGEAQRLRSGKAEKAALLAMADAALTSWPDSARSANDEWFMLTENGVYEYGGSQTVSDKSYHGFKKSDASWLLPLCRTVYFHEAKSIFPSAASVQDCAATFQDVPLAVIEFTGGMDPAVFDAFLGWVATKPMKVLKACNYSTERNSLSNLRDSSKRQLADFKSHHKLS